MHSPTGRRHARRTLSTLALIIALQGATIRRARAEDRIDFKYLYYQEADNRIQVLAPAVLLEKEWSPTFSMRIEGIYNAISGASPTGAPLVTTAAPRAPAATQSYSQYVRVARDNEREVERDREEEREHEDEENESDDKRLIRPGGIEKALSPRATPGFHTKAGATQAPAPKPASKPKPKPSTSKTTTRTAAPSATAPTTSAPVANQHLPTAEVDDQREAVNLELIKRLGDHSVSALFSLSSEEDYDSVGLSLRDAVDFNKRTTTLQYGGAYTHDTVDAFSRNRTEDKDTIEGMIGVTQVLTPKTLFTVNLTLGQVNGYLDDQYKVVELNGKLVPERRPDSKDKQIVYLSLSHFIDALNGSIEGSYRYYNDSFGIRADTYTLAWYQKLGSHWIVSPMLRWYEQSEADFYDVRFSGSPSFYSADYRVSAFRAMGYGLKFIWRPSDRWSIDLSGEHYEQEGTDGVTPQEAYPSANSVTAGVRLWF